MCANFGFSVGVGDVAAGGDIEVVQLDAAGQLAATWRQSSRRHQRCGARLRERQRARGWRRRLALHPVDQPVRDSRPPPTPPREGLRPASWSPAGRGRRAAPSMSSCTRSRRSRTELMFQVAMRMPDGPGAPGGSSWRHRATASMAWTPGRAWGRALEGDFRGGDGGAGLVPVAARASRRAGVQKQSAPVGGARALRSSSRSPGASGEPPTERSVRCRINRLLRSEIGLRNDGDKGLSDTATLGEKLPEQPAAACSRIREWEPRA